MTNIFFLVVLFLANAIQAITGFAGTVLAMPPSILLIGMDNAKIVLGAMAWLSGLFIAIQNYRFINFKELIKMIVLMFVGMLVGMKIYEVLPASGLLTFYGLLVVCIGLKNLLIKKKFEMSQVFLVIVLLVAGIIHGMFVSGGALLVVYATAVLKDKNEFRATVAPIWVVLNTFMMFGYFKSGMVKGEDILLILVSMLPLFIAIAVGNRIQKKINQQTFLRLTYVLLIISGLSILV